jgi:hypothetical protein
VHKLCVLGEEDSEEDVRFNHVHAVIFVCPLRAFDQVLFEGEATNRMASYTV